MDDKQKQIDELQIKISLAEKELEAAKRALFELTGSEPNQASNTPLISLNVSADGKIIEGIFNGENMVGPDGKVYPVPANYASKSKLVEGDKLKLTIADDGTFTFKQIEPIKRNRIVGELKFENNAYHVSAEGNNYSVLYASVSYYKAKPGDRVTILVPADKTSHWAAFENIIHDVEPSAEEPAQPAQKEEPKEEAKEIVTEAQDIQLPEIKNEPHGATAPSGTTQATVEEPVAQPQPEAPAQEAPADLLDIDTLEIKKPGEDVQKAAAEAAHANDLNIPSNSPTITQNAAPADAKPVAEMEI